MRPRGIYLYCIIQGDKARSFGNIGLEGQQVRSIPCGGISAVVHDCFVLASRTNPLLLNQTVRHQEVIDKISKETDVLLPMRFNTVVRDEKTLKEWLRKEHSNLKAKCGELRGKVELGVQVFCDVESLGRKAVYSNKFIEKARKSGERGGEGIAYLEKVKAEQIIRKDLTLMMDEYCGDFYQRLKRHVVKIKAEKAKRSVGMQMLMNLALLVEKEKVRDVGSELMRIKKTKGFDVRFTGPWPPYSFV